MYPPIPALSSRTFFHRIGHPRSRRRRTPNMANCCGSGARPHREDAHNSALGATRPRKSLRTHRDAAPSLAFSARRLGSHGDPEETCGKLGPAVRARKRKEHMKRARHKQGSVVCDKRRRVWNYLFCENGVRRTRLIGSLRDFPTKAAAWQAAESFRQTVVNKPISQTHTVKELAQRYQSERMPSRSETSRVYRSWLQNHILPHWGDKSIADVQPRPVELWLRQLDLSPKSRSHVRKPASRLDGVCDVVRRAGSCTQPHRPCRCERCYKTGSQTSKPHFGAIPKTHCISEDTVQHNGSGVGLFGIASFGATCFEVARRGLARCQVEH